MIKLSPYVKLPLEYIKGTEAQRFALAEKLTDDFLSVAKTEFANNPEHCAIPKKLEKTFLNLLPAKIKLKLVPENNSNFAYTSFSLNSSQKMVKKHNIHLKFSKNNEKIQSEEVYNLMHELRHIADYITNPKLLARTTNMFEKGYDNKLNQYLLDNILYTQNKLSKNKFIRKIALKIASLFQSTDEHINFLQKARYTLKTERNAFKKMFEYQKQTNKACGLYKKLQSDSDILRQFDFDNKIKSIEKQLEYTLKKARKQHAESLQ